MKMFRHLATASMVVAAALAGSSCKEDEPGFKTVTLSGTVERIDSASSRVEISYYSEKRGRHVTTEAILTPETEIFINGELARLEDVRIGERAEGEAIVTRENDRRIVTVRRVHIERARPMAPSRLEAPERNAPTDAAPRPADAGGP